MKTLREIRLDAVRLLEEAGCDTARLDVDLLMEAAMGLSKLDIILEPDLKASEKQTEDLEKLLTRRIAREPISQILGEKEFWSLTFKVNRHCLTPRPDSETLVEAALKAISDKKIPLKILDLGTGSGCLLLSLLSELPNSSGVGVDMSERALAVATENAERFGLLTRCKFILSDWAEQLPPSSRFDIILCNPPYIAMGEKAELSPDVREYEPHSALFATDEGYREYMRLLEIIPRLAITGTAVFLEIGHTQGQRVAEMFNKTKAKNIRIIQDLAGRDRCVAFNY